MKTDKEYRYCLSDNDIDMIEHNTKKPLSSNAEKTLIILSEVFGGLHHIDSDQLKLFDYQSSFFNEYLFHGSLATFDNMNLTCLIIIAHDMAVRLELQSARLDPEDADDRRLLDKQLEDYNSEYSYNESMEEFCQHTKPYIKLLFHERKREGRFYERHPTLEDSTEGFRSGNKRYA